MSQAEATQEVARATCPTCRRATRTGQRFCGSCGSQLPSLDVRIPPSPAPEDRPALPLAVIQRLSSENDERRTPRELEFRLGLALRRAARYGDAVLALQRALAESGTAPETVAIRLFLAEVHQQAGALDLAVRSYLEAVADDTQLAGELLPYVHRLLNPEISAAIAAWFEVKWEAAVSSADPSPIDRLHIELFRSRVHLYLGNHGKARESLTRAKESNPQHFADIAPALLAFETLPPAVAAPKDGNSLLALAEICQQIGDPNARALVDRALVAGLSDGTEYAEAPAYALKASLLESWGDVQEAARWFYEAGRRYAWRTDRTRALSLLEKAESLNPDHAPTCWQLMDLHRDLSYMPQAPYVDREHIAASLRYWERGIQLTQPGRDFWWAYTSRALVNEQLTRLPGADIPAANWEGVAYLERGLLAAGDDADQWAYLGRFHRELFNPACSLDATEKAVGLDPKHPLALEERAAILSDVGDAAAALAVIEQRRDVDSASNAWLDVLKAYNLLHTGPLTDALALLNGVIGNGPGEVWHVELRAACHRRLKQWTQAAEDSQRVWSRYDKADTSEQSRFAWAAYYLGDVQNARRLLEELPPGTTPASDRSSGLGMCALALGELDIARGLLERAISEVRDERDLNDLLLDDFPTAEHFAEQCGEPQPVRDLFASLNDAVRTRRSALAEAGSAASELQEIVRQLEQRRPGDSWAWVGSHAGLARVYMQAGRWHAAAEIYQRLQSTGKFPEADLGIRSTIGHASSEAADHLRDGRAREASDTVRRALAFVSRKQHAELRGDLHSLLGMIHLSDDDRAAGDEFLRAVASYRAHDGQSGERLAAQCRPHLASASRYWALSDCWEGLAASPRTSSADRDDLATARQGLMAYWAEAFGLSDTPAVDRLNFVTPIILEVGEALLPFVDPGQDGGKFLFTDIEDMRKRIALTLGVETPGVRARPTASDSASANVFRILLDEVPTAAGEAYPAMRYCPAGAGVLESAGVPPDTVRPAVNLVTGDTGAWVPAEYGDTLTQRSVETMDAMTFVVIQLEAVLCRNAAMLLGVEEVETLLARWKETEEGNGLISALLSDHESRLRVARLLRALVKEEVSIVPWKDILQVVHEVGLADDNRTLHEVRYRLRDFLAGNPPIRPKAVPKEWEGWVRRATGRASFIASPAETHDAMAVVRTWMLGADPPNVLVTETPELRVFLKRLIETEFPRVRVLTQRELAPPDGVSASTGPSLDALANA